MSRLPTPVASLTATSRPLPKNGYSLTVGQALDKMEARSWREPGKEGKGERGRGGRRRTGGR
eukprot:761879-Hanusia_phi.AAC.1